MILQSFGTPHGSGQVWDDLAKEVQRLGGNRQVFEAMNTTEPFPLNGEVATRKGPYALIGREGSTAPLAEASYSLNGDPGRLRGVLMRSHDGGYEPMLDSPPLPDGNSVLNEQLIRIADQAPQPFAPFKRRGWADRREQAQAVQKFLNETVKVCNPTQAVCDIRQSYYESYRTANWESIQTDLLDAETRTCVQGASQNAGFTGSPVRSASPGSWSARCQRSPR